MYLPETEIVIMFIQKGINCCSDARNTTPTNPYDIYKVLDEHEFHVGPFSLCITDILCLHLDIFHLAVKG